MIQGRIFLSFHSFGQYFVTFRRHLMCLAHYLRGYWIPLSSNQTKRNFHAIWLQLKRGEATSNIPGNTWAARMVSYLRRESQRPLVLTAAVCLAESLMIMWQSGQQIALWIVFQPLSEANIFGTPSLFWISPRCSSVCMIPAWTLYSPYTIVNNRLWAKHQMCSSFEFCGNNQEKPWYFSLHVCGFISGIGNIQVCFLTSSRTCASNSQMTSV